MKNPTPDFSSGEAPGRMPKKPAEPQIGAVKKAIKEHSKLCDNLYKFPEPDVPVQNQTAKDALMNSAYNTPGQNYFSNAQSTDEKTTNYPELTPVPLANMIAPIQRRKKWDSLFSLTRTGVPRPALLNTGEKGFLKSLTGGRKYMTGGMTGEAVDTRGQLQGSAQGVISAIKRDASVMHDAQKRSIDENLNEEVKQQQENLRDFYFGAGNATINSDKSITINNPAALTSENFQNFCTAYVPASVTDKKSKETAALAAISNQLKAIETNAELIRRNIDEIQETERLNLDKDLQAKRELELENLHTKEVNALKKDVYPDKTEGATLQAENGDYKIPASKVKKFNVGGTKVSENVDENGKVSYQFHRGDPKDREKQFNPLNPFNLPRTLGTLGATGFRLGITALAVIFFPPSIFFINWKQLKKDLSSDLGKMTLPFADTRQKRDFDKFLDILIQPHHTIVTGTEDLTEDEQRHLWLKANIIAPEDLTKDPPKPAIKVMIGSKEYKPTLSDQRKLEQIQSQRTQKVEVERVKAEKNARQDMIDGLLKKGDIKSISDDMKKDMSKQQKEQYRLVRDMRDWLEHDFDRTDEDKAIFKKWWDKEGKKEFESWNKSLSGKKQLSDYQQEQRSETDLKTGAPKEPNKDIGHNINRDKLNAWFEKSSISDKFDAYKTEQVGSSIKPTSSS